jgi:hypothetical protein
MVSVDYHFVVSYPEKQKLCIDGISNIVGFILPDLFIKIDLFE